MANATINLLKINYAGGTASGTDDVDAFYDLESKQSEMYTGATPLVLVMVEAGEVDDGSEGTMATDEIPGPTIHSRKIDPEGATDDLPSADVGATSYGEFENDTLTKLFKDICTAESQKTEAGLYWGLDQEDEAAASELATKAFAHYMTQAIAGIINNLDIEIQLQADSTASAVSSNSIALSVAGSASAQTGTATAVTDVSSAIEASTFTVTIRTKS